MAHSDNATGESIRLARQAGTAHAVAATDASRPVTTASTTGSVISRTTLDVQPYSCGVPAIAYVHSCRAHYICRRRRLSPSQWCGLDGTKKLKTWRATTPPLQTNSSCQRVCSDEASSHCQYPPPERVRQPLGCLVIPSTDAWNEHRGRNKSCAEVFVRLPSDEEHAADRPTHVCERAPEKTDRTARCRSTGRATAS